MTAPSRGEREYSSLNGLEETLLQRGYTLVQRNGQRISCSQTVVENPRKGCEVFVGKLPHDATEEELLPFFEKVGKIRLLRLMVDYKGQNRGFGFITYDTVAAAQKAVHELNQGFLRPHKRIAVVWSVDNRRLFIGGLPPRMTADEIREELSKTVADIENVILYPCAHDPNRNRGFAFIEFKDHMAAAIARKHLQSVQKNSLFNDPLKTSTGAHHIQVDWASPEPQIDPDVMAKVTNLFVRNVSVEITEEELTKMFSFDGQLEVTRVRRPSNFAFIHFAHREHAQQAMERLDGFESHGLKLEIEWAKPPPKEQKNHVHEGYRSRPARHQRFRERPLFGIPHHLGLYHAPRVHPSSPQGEDVGIPHSQMMGARSYYELLNHLSYQMFGEPVRYTVLTCPTEQYGKLFYVYVTYGNHTEVFDRLFGNRELAIEAASASFYEKLRNVLAQTQ